MEVTKRELNMLIAEKIFNWTWGDFILPTKMFRTEEDITIEPIKVLWSPDKKDNSSMGHLPKYCEDMNDAWKVVEKLNDRYYFEIYREKLFFKFGYYVKFSNNSDTKCSVKENEFAPIAICLAALQIITNEAYNVIDK